MPSPASHAPWRRTSTTSTTSKADQQGPTLSPIPPYRAFFYWNAVSPDYFRTMGIPIDRGRTFQTGGDAATSPVIVNRTFAQRYLADRDPLGRTFLWGDNKEIYAVVGLVDATKNF